MPAISVPSDRSTSSNNYDITQDPFAIFSFALLCSGIIVFLFLITITARRSSQEIWTSVRSKRTQNPDPAPISQKKEKEPHQSEEEEEEEEEEEAAHPFQYPEKPSPPLLTQLAIHLNPFHRQVAHAPTVRFSNLPTVHVIPPPSWQDLLRDWHDDRLRASERTEGERRKEAKRLSEHEQRVAELWYHPV